MLFTFWSARFSGFGTGGNEGPINTNDSFPFALEFFDDFALFVLFNFDLANCSSNELLAEFVDVSSFETALKACLETSYRKKMFKSYR